ncbi:WecB/TagA/CpsF family glycosyltransferase [Listeria rustica]|uniref:WecB/TagA/CpsF family glycosyltransferase n=1 Tax=Listeria rustica TaxID=2713503 RepID=A0A7W1YHM6_9LIST|nr:WecB/TagA/CpsF family glycosyltransferase [Listeria rustica]MBA3927799.1 WecB/TagA/CpsF family glycosyltransferase [Listeria rustica]
MRTQLLGSNLDCLTLSETLKVIEGIIKKGIPTQHVVINANKINLMHEDAKLRDIVNASPLINADGSSIVLAGKLLGHDIPERVTGIDLFEELLEICNDKGYRPYFLGATQEVIGKIESHYKQKYPNMSFAGFRNGYFQPEESADIADTIRESKADVLFLAFSSPQKEYWASEHLERLDVPFVMGVGGSFDVIAGKTTRAPQWMQKAGLEWFYRFIQEPRRMFRRYFLGNLQFLNHIKNEKVKSWKANRYHGRRNNERNY